MRKSRSRLSRLAALAGLPLAAGLLGLFQTKINFSQLGKDVVLARVEDVPRKNMERQRLTQETLRVLHSDADTLKQLHADDYYDTYRLLSGYLAYLDETLQPRTTEK